MRKAIVVDLDGTLLNTNTFIHYIRFVFKEALKKGDFFRAGWISMLVCFRKVRLISSHEKLKEKILLCSKCYTDSQRMSKLATILLEYENKNTISILDRYRTLGYSTILSSAAPNVYTDIIGKYYSFENVCSTEMPKDKDWHENVNEKKKMNTLTLLEMNNLELAVVVTDHYDDLPLLLIEKEKNYVVNPSEKSRRIIDESGVRCQYVYDE